VDLFVDNIHNNKKLLLGAAFLISHNNKTVSFSNSKSAAWFDDQGNPQDIDPFFLKEHVGRDENNKPKEIAKIDTANFLLKQN
jgi:hypothetical protein